MPNTLLKKIKIFTGSVGNISPPGGGTTVGVIGSGTLNYVAKFTPNGTSVGNSILFDDGTNIGLGLTSLTARLHIQGSDSTSSNYALKVDNSSNTPLLYVRNDGSVGIGGTSIYSTYKFQILVGVVNDGLQIIGGGVGTATLTTDTDGASGSLKLYNSTLGYNGVILNNTSDSSINTGYSFGIGVSSPNASAKMEILSTTKGFLPPRMTTTQKNTIPTPIAGLMVYDITLNKLCVFTTTWQTVTSV